MRLPSVLPEYPPDSGGGTATFYGALLPALARQGHEVQVVAGSAFTHGGAAYEHEGVRVRWVRAAARPGRGADPNAFLSHFPIKMLARHVARRVGVKLSPVRVKLPR